MNLDKLLFDILTIMTVPNWVVTFILTRAALRKPRIQFLTTTAAASLLVAMGITVYVLAVLNANAGYPFDREWVRVIFRLVLLGISIYPLWWLWLYVSGRFRDGDA